jgi:MurNAc alpha-1-phosphate uridylyltransferase
VCILAGGLGTRLGPAVREVPKPLLEVAGEPFLRHQLRLLAAHGAREVVICVGYLGALIEECIGYRQFGIDIEYSYDGARPLGTLGAIRKASSLLGPQFLVLYGDTYLRLNYRTAVEAWDKSGLPAMMTVLRNEGRWDVSNASFDGTFVTAYDKLSPVSKMQYIDYGLGGLRDNALELTESQSTDLSDLYQGLAKRRLLFGFEATERFYEIGTPIALAETSAFMAGLRRNATIRSTPPKLNDDA